MQKNEVFKIYVDQLRISGNTEQISESVSPDFLGIKEEELSFPENVKIKGETYVADNSLILRLYAETVALIPCSVCNENVEVEIKLESFYHSEPLEDIHSGLFYYDDVLRDAILLEVPLFAECQGGKCQARKELEKYMRPKSKILENGEEGYQPFADLDLQKVEKKSKKQRKS